MDSETTRPISIPPTTAEDVSSTDTSRKDVARHIDNAPLMTMAQTLFAQSAPTTIAPLSEEGRMAGSRRSLERPSSPPAIQTKTSSSSVFARQPLPSMASNAASLLSSVGASGTGKGVSVKSFSKSVAGSQVSTGTTASILSSISLAGSPEKLWVQTQNDTRANARPNLTQEPLPWDGTMSHNTRPMRIPDHQAGVEIPTDSMAPLPSTRHPLSLNHMHQHERYSSDNTTATATSTASPTGQTMMDHPAFFPPLACTTGPLYQTMPRMSSGIIRTSPFSTTPKVARRAHSTKVSSAPGRVLIKKRASLQQQDSFGEAVSPVTSESFSSLGQSPAISFLASMSDALSILHSREFFCNVKRKHT